MSGHVPGDLGLDCHACARHAAERRLNRMFLGAMLVVGAACVTALIVSGNWRVVVAWLARVSY